MHGKYLAILYFGLFCFFILLVYYRKSPLKQFYLLMVVSLPEGCLINDPKYTNNIGAQSLFKRLMHKCHNNILKCQKRPDNTSTIAYHHMSNVSLLQYLVVVVSANHTQTKLKKTTFQDNTNMSRTGRIFHTYAIKTLINAY